MTFSKSNALASLRPGAQFVMRGGVIEFYQHDDAQPTEEELQAEIVRLNEAQPMVELREERNRRLAETDYLALSDVTLTPEMAAYRQELRDLPVNTADPVNPTWPVKPGAA